MARTQSLAQRDPNATRRVCRCALLAALAVAVAAAEALVPMPAPIPGMKLGLANTVTVIAAFWLGPAEATVVLAVRILLCAVLAGQLAALPFSLVGGVCALAVTLAFVHLNARGKVRLCCMAAAVAHNCGQIAMAAILTATPQIALHLPILLVVGTATGYATGTLAATVLERLPHLLASATNRIDYPNAESSPGGTASEQHGAGACAPHPDRSTPSAERPHHA